MLSGLRSWASRQIHRLWSWRKPALLATGAGLASTLTAFISGPMIAALLCGLSASTLCLIGTVLTRRVRVTLS